LVEGSAAKEAREECQKAGLEVTSRWIEMEDKDVYSKNELRKEAREDLTDICDSDMFILLNTQSQGQETGGHSFETGVACTLGLPVIIVGEATNVFHHLEGITIVDSVKKAIEVVHVKGIEWEEGTWGSDHDRSPDRRTEGLEAS